MRASCSARPLRQKSLRGVTRPTVLQRLAHLFERFPREPLRKFGSRNESRFVEEDEEEEEDKEDEDEDEEDQEDEEDEEHEDEGEDESEEFWQNHVRRPGIAVNQQAREARRPSIMAQGVSHDFLFEATVVRCIVGMLQCNV